MKTRRRWASWSVAFVLALVAPMTLAFGGRVSAQDAPPITVWFDTTGGSETADCIIANVIDPYNERGGAQVDATLQANNWDATRTAIAGGGGPDIVGTPGPSFAFELARAGQLLPLDEISQGMGWAERFVPWALDLGKVDGQLYSIPNEVETLVLYYNKTLFEEQGWENRRRPSPT
jgi:raffinose/stachyose/melibiose transport system substrate-binding protein